MKLYKFYWDCGRMGDLEGLFAEDPEVIAKAIGHDVYFGEVLGKHSDIYGKLEEGDLKEIDIDEESVKKFIDAIGNGTTISGYNPISYMYQYDDETGKERLPWDNEE